MSPGSWPVVRHGSRWREDLPGTLWRWLLLPGWLVFRPIVSLNRLWWDQGWGHAKKLPVPVISVGNLIAGGAGKTPVAMQVAKIVAELGHHPAVLARGYRSDADGRNDEARMFGSVPVFCARDRVIAGQRALAAGLDTLILDDGMQHRRLHRDLDIVVVDATRPWGDVDGSPGHVLPLGYRREPRTSIARAGLIWITRTDLVSSAHLSALHADLDRLAAGVPRVQMPVTRVRWLQVAAGTMDEHPATSGPLRLVALSGIGHPQAFEALVHRHGATWGAMVVESHRFPDHHQYTPVDAENLRQRARSLGARLIMTGKDAVKWRELPAGDDADARILDPEATLSDLDLALIRSQLSKVLHHD